MHILYKLTTMGSNKRVYLQGFTAEQARKLILECDSRPTDHLTLMLMTTLMMNQKQNKFQFWNTVQMRAVSDLEQTNSDGPLQDSDENISGKILGTCCVNLGLEKQKKNV